MSEIIFHKLNYGAVIEGLRRFAADLKACPEVREVILIGSLAKGTWSARSDADVVILVDHAKGPSAFRAADYLPDCSPGIPMDLFVYTPEETTSWGPRFRAEVERGVMLFRRQHETV